MTVYPRLPETFYVASPPDEPLKVDIVGADVVLEVDTVDIGNIVIEGGVSGNKAEVTSSNALKVDGSATIQPVSLSTIPLATDASTLSAQVSAQTSLSSLDTKATASNASLVSIDSKLTSPVIVTGTFFQATQPVSIAGTVSVSGPLTDTQLRATPVPVSGTVVLSTSSDVIGHVIVDFAPTTAVTIASLPVGHNIIDSGVITTVSAITAGNITVINGAAGSAVNIQDGGNTITVDGTVGVSGSVAVTGTFFQTTQPISDANLELAQGTSSASTVGPMVQAVVSDVPQSYVDGYVQPLSLTADGRLRVSTVSSDITRIWQNTFNNFWSIEDINYTSEVAYV